MASNKNVIPAFGPSSQILVLQGKPDFQIKNIVTKTLILKDSHKAYDNWRHENTISHSSLKFSSMLFSFTGRTLVSWSLKFPNKECYEELGIHIQLAHKELMT